MARMEPMEPPAPTGAAGSEASEPRAVWPKSAAAVFLAVLEQRPPLKLEERVEPDKVVVVSRLAAFRVGAAAAGRPELLAVVEMIKEGAEAGPAAATLPMRPLPHPRPPSRATPAMV